MFEELDRLIHREMERSRLPGAERGRVTGHVDVSVPGLGEFRVFLWLRAAGGLLVGKSYARGTFGETPMKTELRLER